MKKINKQKKINRVESILKKYYNNYNLILKYSVDYIRNNMSYIEFINFIDNISNYVQLSNNDQEIILFEQISYIIASNLKKENLDKIIFHGIIYYNYYNSAISYVVTQESVKFILNGAS